MPKNKTQLVTLMCLIICAIAQLVASLEHAQALLHGTDDGTLHIEAVRDKNITLRLIGDASKVLGNNRDMVLLLQRRRRSLLLAVRREPLSLDILKDQFQVTHQDIMRLGKGVSNMYNGTRRSGVTQRVLRRDLQRVQLIANFLTTLERNLSKDNCFSNPCKNGGACNNTYNSFNCDCASGWQGLTCEEDINECSNFASTDLAVCQNEGQCVNTPGSYRCNCQAGFSGAHCRLRQDTCLKNQSAELCGNKGTCVSSRNEAGFVCICEAGWTWADVNVSVPSASPCSRDVDECTSQANPCHNECINLPGSFRCGACPPGYTGNGRHCRDTDECADGNNGGCSTRPLVNCINTDGSSRCGRCPPGWSGDGRVCSEVKTSSCDNEHICHPRAQCEYISNTVICTCSAGFFGHGYGADGCTEDSSRKPCEHHYCKNNSTCVLNARGTSCICQPGFTGPLCDKADACHPNPCQNGGMCRLLPDNQHTCVCLPGFTGVSCAHVRSYCGVVIRNATGSLQYPPSEGFPSYQPNERCAFIIRTLPGLVLNLTFDMFDIQSSADCSADFLQLHDGSSLTARQIGRFCGRQLSQGNNTVVTTQEQLFFWFRSDNATQAHGFHISWHSVPLVCGENLENMQLAATGILRSPNYPGKARFGLDCRWKLAALFGTRLLLRFYEITLGNDSANLSTNCSNGDSLSVWDSDRLLYKTCQSSQPPPLHSSSNLLRIQFHTDTYRSDSSFQLHYEVVQGHPGCGGIFTGPTGQIKGAVQAELCLYLIEQPRGTQVQLNFLGKSHATNSDCNRFKVEIFDGRTDEQPLLLRFCGNTEDTERQSLTSSSNVVLVRYYDGLWALNEHSTVELRYQRVCGANFSNIESNVIRTPNYPNGYLEHLQCTYGIHAPVGSEIRILIKDLSLSETADEITTKGEDQSSYLDVFISRNKSNVRHFDKNMTNFELIIPSNQARLVFHGAENLRRARGLYMEYRSVKKTCGGVMTTPSYSGASAFYRYCQYVIDTPGLKYLEIKLRRGLWRMNDKVPRLSLYENSTASQGRLLKIFSQSDEGETIVNEYFDWDVLTIIVTGSDDEFLSLTLKYSTVKQACGYTYLARYGQIKSPNWPFKYPSLSNCTWVIKAPFGRRLELIVQSFTLETTSKACNDDYLEIRNGDQPTSPLIGRYCGDKIPSRIPSYGNALFLFFRSDSYIEWKGFQLTWQQTSTGCGGKLSSPSGVIHSPHSIEGNRGALTCDWQITVAEGSTVQVKIQANSDLCNGHLTLFDGPNTVSNQIPYNCSNIDQQMLNATGNHVLVRYESGSDTPDGINFVLDYSTNCRVRLKQVRGAIETPNFPGEYPPNMKCEWDIIGGGKNNHIQMVFSHLSVEASGPSDCYFDYVLLGDYRDNQLINERRICSSQDIDVTSVGNRLRLRFNSDSSNEAQGFRAEYQRVGCGGELQGLGGTFKTPNAPYSVDMDCEWLITVPEGYQIRLLFYELHIETAKDDCSEDKLTVFSGNDNQLLFTSCKIESSVQTMVSPANQFRVRFSSSSRRARKFFSANYTVFPATCGGYVSGSMGTVTSPGFYERVAEVSDKYMECAWDIEVADGYMMAVNFESFNFTDSPNCSRAHLKLWHMELRNSNSYSIHCGSQAPRRLYIKSSFRFQLMVMAGSWGRFKMEFRQVCGGPRTESEGYIHSTFDEHCTWNISVKEGSKVSLNIYQLDCERCSTPGKNCTNGLSIKNSEDEVEYFSLCEEHPVSIIIPSSHVLIITHGVTFTAQYSSFVNTCGGNITSVRGTLTSPGYPASYSANVECVWTVEARAGNAIEITFEEMDIVKSEHCNSHFLELRAGVHGSLVGLYCGEQLPTEPLILKSQLWIKFRSQPGYTAKGFKLRWSYVYNNEITEGTNGTIESPPTASVRGADQSFSWRIFTERQRVVFLNFIEYQTGVMLYDGYDDTALSVNVESAPWQFTSSSNVVYLKTVNEDFDGFRLQWHVLRLEDLKPNTTLKTEVCNKVYILKNEWVRLHSPGYPGYKPNLFCEWTFMPEDPTKHVYVDLFEVKLEVFDHCSADYLSVQSSSNKIDWPEQLRICNSNEFNGNRFQRVSGTPYLRLQFVSDATVNGTGFRSIIRTECGSNMTGSVGTILNSHTQRQVSFETLACEWHIAVQPGKVIEFTIDYSKSVSNESCQHYGFIYDGLDADAMILAPGKFCNQQGYSTRTFHTSGPNAFIRYVYPANNFKIIADEVGWNLTYREFSECDAEVRLTHLSNSYVISTPGYPFYPHPHADCTWLIIAPAGETIAANFVDDFELSQHNCDKEFVEMFDGSTKLSRRILRTCRRTGTTYSTKNILLLHYTTQLNEPRGGFRLNVSLSGCGGQFNTQSGTINSEHYPSQGAYPKPAVCEYIIQTPANTHIQLNFTDLHLPLNKDFEKNNENDGIDRLELVDLTDQRIILILYGNLSVPYPITVSTNQLLVRFITVQMVNSFRGFQLKYKTKIGTCHREVNAASGELELKKVRYNNNFQYCFWRITVPKGQLVRLELLNLQDLRSRNVSLSPTRSIKKQFIFYNDPTYQSKIIEFGLRDYNGDGIVESTDNFMIVRILLMQQTVDLRARFSSTKSSLCPLDIGAQEFGLINVNEIISLPSYYCAVHFVADHGVTISFNVLRLHSRGQRPTTIFRIWDEVLHSTINVNYDNTTYSLATTAGQLRFLKQSGDTALPLRITYRRNLCGGSVNLAEGSKIDLPQQLGHNGQLECIWTLRFSIGYRLSGNVSFSESCDREYLLVSRFGFAGDLAKLCGNATNLNSTLLDALQVTVLYHALEYHPGRSQIQLQASRPQLLSGTGNTVWVGRVPTPPVTIDANNYKDNMELSWEFRTNFRMALRLEFLGRFFIEMSSNCSYDHLEVLANRQGLWYSIVKLCGRDKPEPLLIDATHIRIVFRTNGNTTADGFTFVVTSSCDIKLVASTELKTEPLTRGGRWTNLQCKVDITTDTNEELLVAVKSNLRRRLVQLYCRTPLFQVYRKNGEQQAIGNNCGDFEVTGYKRLSLHYASVPSVDMRFELHYQLVSCGGNYTAPFVLRSPLGNSMSTNINGYRCEWHVRAAPHQAIFLRFKYLQIESSPICKQRHVSIYRGNIVTDEQRISRLCGNLTNYSVMVDSNQATIVSILTELPDSNAPAFVANIHFTPNCNERLALGEGNTRINLVRHYQFKTTNSEYLHCVFRATTVPGNRLSVWLKQLQLNAIPCKNCNSLEVIDGFEKDSESMGTFHSVVGNGTKLFSTSQDLLILLSGTGAQTNEISFELILEMETTACGQTSYNFLSNETLNLRLNSTHLKNYKGSVYCVWEFKVDFEVEIEISSVQLQGVSQSTGKCIDYLLIAMDYSNKYYCGKFNNTILDAAKNSKLTLTFRTSGERANDLMDVYLSKKRNCNNTFSSLSGVIRFYEAEQGRCDNTIRVPEGYFLALEILFFTFERSFPYEYFNVTDLQTNRTIYNFTKTEPSKTVHTTSNVIGLRSLGVSFLNIFFYSTNSKLPPGCGGELATLDGQISSPDYNNRNYSDCSWLVSVPEGITLQFFFNTFNMGSEANCYMDNVKFYEILPDNSEKLHATFCGQDEREAFFVRYNRIKIVARKSPNFNGIGFQLYYHNIDN